MLPKSKPEPRSEDFGEVSLEEPEDDSGNWDSDCMNLIVRRSEADSLGVVAAVCRLAALPKLTGHSQRIVLETRWVVVRVVEVKPCHGP